MGKNKQNIFVFDGESDGLYGDVFAIGVVVMDKNFNTIDQFLAVAEIEAVKDDWVRKNIIPKLGDYPRFFESRKEMRDVFWGFLQRYTPQCSIWADFQCPVEAGLIRQCVADDPKNRLWQGPYPLHELGTLAWIAGIDPDFSREEFVGMDNNLKHNPLFDAIVAAKCILKILNRIEYEKGR